MCLVPDGDLFEAISPAAARRSSPTGSRPSPRTGSSSSRATELEADLIVTATGLNLLPLGGVNIVRRRRAGRLVRRRWATRGMMLERRPEPGRRARLHERVLDAQVRPDLRVRLPAAQPHGRARLPQVRAATTATRPSTRSRSSTSTPATSCARSTSSRSRARRHPWRLYQNYARDILALRYGELDDEALEFSRGVPAPTPAELAAHR